jgi:uncharacterized phosphatase
MERDYGAASGLTPEERRERFPHDDVPGMEGRGAVLGRAGDALETLSSRYPDGHILVVAHGGLINAMLAVVSHGEIGTGKTVLHNACLSVLHFRGSGWEIESHNLISHLQ